MLNRWQRTIVDLRGNVVPYAQLQIRVESTQATATIYADRAGNELIPNGIVTADANGYAFFYAEADLYRISSAEPTIDWRYVDIGAAGALQRGNDLSDITNPATARGNLGLGEAATRNVGTSSGNVMEVGAFGWGGRALADSYIQGYPTTLVENVTQAYRRNTEDGEINPFSASIHFAAHNTWGRLRVNHLRNRAWLQGGYIEAGGGFGGAWTGEIHHTGNTTVDGNGFIKSASPVIHLYDNKIELEGFEQETPAFEKVDVGVYRITGTSGLAQEGWYIDTPQDRNGNKYFNVDWEQDTTPELNSDGLLDEPANVTLIIRTFERVWNPTTGVFDNGNPMDINELQSRHIALRFNEVRSESTDDETEWPANPIEDSDAD